MKLETKLTIAPAWLKLAVFHLPMDKVGKRLHTSALQNYNQQRSPAGIPWIPSLRAEKEGGKTLIDTGLMLASLTYVSGADWAEVGYPRGAKNIPAWLHYGVRQNNLPSREHLGVREEDQTVIDDIMQRYFEDLLHG